MQICYAFVCVYIYIYVREMFGPQNVNWWSQDQPSRQTSTELSLIPPFLSEHLSRMCDALPTPAKRARGVGPEMTPTGVCVCVCACAKTLLSH